ncbi:MAG: magnesium/cobalt transporter CorA [Pseudomonadota bacterium]
MRTPKPLRIPLFSKRRRRRSAPGADPGTLVMASDLPAMKLRLTHYQAEVIEERDLGFEELPAVLAQETGGVTWIDVQGLGDEASLRRVGNALALHPLVLEDIAHVHQRPKVEDYDSYLFIVLRCVRLLEDGRVDNEQLSLVLKQGVLVTFQEKAGDGFDAVRRRLRENKGSLRKQGADHLAWALIDVTVDLAFPVLEAYGEAMDRIDDEVHQNPTPQISRGIHDMKRELRMLRRALWPLRDVTSALSRDDLSFLGDSAATLFRDCHDHAIQMVDFIDGNRERAGDLADRYLAAVSERTNQVMKVLTIIATIFIPLTFLAGIYGMNFDTAASPYNMPELRWRFGYLGFWVFNVVAVVGMLWFFRRKGWLGGGGRPSGQ